MIKMNVIEMKDLHSDLPLTEISTGSFDEYILGDVWDPVNNFIERNIKVEVKTEIDIEDAEDKKLSKFTIMEDYKSDVIYKDVKHDLIVKKKCEIDDKHIINYLLAPEPPEEKHVEHLNDSLPIKKVTHDIYGNTILIDLVADFPSESNSQDVKENLNNLKVPAPKQIPSDSYCRMITRAILSSPDRCISLKNLFLYIAQHYPYYSNEPDGWQAPIEHYLLHSKHFVNALPKDFEAGSTDVWILNPATESKMIARFNRRSSDKMQVNQRNHHNFNSFKINRELIPVNSNRVIHQDQIVNPSESSLNNEGRNFSHVTLANSTENSILKYMQPQRPRGILIPRKNESSISKSNSSTLLEQLISSKSTKISSIKKLKRKRNDERNIHYNKILNPPSTTLDKWLTNAAVINKNKKFPLVQTGNKGLTNNNLNVTNISRKVAKRNSIHSNEQTDTVNATSCSTEVFEISSEDDENSSFGHLRSESELVNHGQVTTCSKPPNFARDTDQSTLSTNGDVVMRSATHPSPNPTVDSTQSNNCTSTSLNLIPNVKSTVHDKTPNCSNSNYPDMLTSLLRSLLCDSSSLKGNSLRGESQSLPSDNSPDNSQYTLTGKQRTEAKNSSFSNKVEQSRNEIQRNKNPSHFSLNSHLKNHKGLTENVCKQCCKGFSSKARLDIHTHLLHSNVKFVEAQNGNIVSEMESGGENSRKRGFTDMCSKSSKTVNELSSNTTTQNDTVSTQIHVYEISSEDEDVLCSGKQRFVLPLPASSCQQANTDNPSQTDPINETSTASIEDLNSQELNGLNRAEDTYNEQLVDCDDINTCFEPHTTAEDNRNTSVDMNTHTFWNTTQGGTSSLLRSLLHPDQFLNLANNKDSDSSQQVLAEKSKTGVCDSSLPNNTKESQIETEKRIDDKPETHIDNIFCQWSKKYGQKENVLKRFKCSLCFKKFVFHSRLKRHLRNHTGLKEHVCVQCCKGFTAETSLKAHFQNIHSFSEPLKCSYCSKLFKHLKSLQSHVANFHNVKGKYALGTVSCDLCQKVFKNLKRMRNHRQQQHSEGEFICNECSAVFKRKALLLNHVILHMPPTVKCSKCSELFHTKPMLNTHMRIEHLIDNRTSHICDVCGKISKSLERFKVHMTVHIDERPHVCEECGKSFRTISNLQQHLQSHSDIRSFICDLCGKSFRIRHHLRQHMSVHGLVSVSKYGKHKEAVSKEI